MTDPLRQVAKRHAVKVAGGSGVLVQPASEEYSYVLTAKHVVKESEFPEPSAISILDKDGNSIAVQERYFHQEEDCDLAILKVEFQQGLELGYFYHNLIPGMAAWIYGYPRNRRPEQGTPDEPSTYELRLHDIRDNGVVEFRNLSRAVYDEIEGYSGCGVFFFNEETNKAELIGIENRMAEAEANDGHIRVYLFSKIEEVIQSNNLVEIKPPYLKSFSYHENQMFSAVELQNDAALKCLKDLANKSFGEYNLFESHLITPENIIKSFIDKILADNQNVNHLNDKELWEFFLELLFVQLTIYPEYISEGKDHENFISDFFQRFRPIYDHEKRGYKDLWRRYIAFANLDELEDDSIIMFFSYGKEPRNLMFTRNLEQTVRNIGEAESIDGNISRVLNRNYKRPNTILHWTTIKRICVEEEEERYSSLNIILHEQEIMAAIRETFGKVFEGEYE